MKYSIGIDFGTLSARAIVAEIGTGNVVSQCAMDYPHGVMDEQLPDGTPLKQDWALQHPQDYLDTLEYTVSGAMEEGNISPDDVVGIGIDFTACTPLPIDGDGNPLCFDEKWKGNPHSYVKLWKHHAAQYAANKLNDIAEKRGESFPARVGGKVSSEWMMPKIMQILDEAPELYEAADKIMEAGDWVIMRMTNNEARNACTAGCKALWSPSEGYPSKAFFKELDPRLENLVEDKLSEDIRPLGSSAGVLTAEMAAKLGLKAGTPVAVCNVDAHVSVPGMGITDPGELLMIMGTSTCHMVLDDKIVNVPGICGYVEDGILPDMIGYEAGQSCVGDHFNWFVENLFPAKYAEDAKQKGVDAHQYLTEKAQLQKPGESGLVALDWWNGNRSILVDGDLTGLLIGATLNTKAEEIYRALMEATAYGTRMIIENFEENGMPIKTLYACGGISEKNAFMLQMYADVTNRQIYIADGENTVALGSAMHGAVAAGKAAGGYDSIYDAAGEMAKVREEPFTPIAENVKTYDRLYAEYKQLHDYFGRGENDVMKRLKQIKGEATK